MAYYIKSAAVLTRAPPPGAPMKCLFVVHRLADAGVNGKKHPEQHVQWRTRVTYVTEGAAGVGWYERKCEFQIGTSYGLHEVQMGMHVRHHRCS